MSAMAVSSLPLAVVTESDGASAAGFTTTLRVLVVLAEAPFLRLVSVAITVRAKLPVNSRGGVTVRPWSCAGVSK
jgi:hypothetical protein